MRAAISVRSPLLLCLLAAGVLGSLQGSSPPQSDVPICPDTPTCGPEEVGLTKPFPPDCNKYIYCDEEGGHTRLCPRVEEGRDHFSPLLLHCTTPELANCSLCLIP